MIFKKVFFVINYFFIGDSCPTSIIASILYYVYCNVNTSNPGIPNVGNIAPQGALERSKGSVAASRANGDGEWLRGTVKG